MKVFITRPIPGGAKELLEKAGHEVAVNPEDRPLTAEELKNFVSGSAAILSLLTDKIDASVLDAAGPELKIVANYAVGYDNIDLTAARERNVFVTNTPGVLTESVAEHTFTLLLAVAKKVVEADKYVREGCYKSFAPNLFLGTQLYGKEFGVVGLGSIGSYAAKIAHNGFSMQVLYFGRKPNMEIESQMGAMYCDHLDELLKRADVVSLHCPLTDETRGMIGEAQLALMKKSAILINTARGPIVDEKALIKALREGRIAGAGLDVFENEAQVNPEFYSLPNVVLTPHTASSTLEARVEMARIAAENILAALRGENPRDIVR